MSDDTKKLVDQPSIDELLKGFENITIQLAKEHSARGEEADADKTIENAVATLKKVGESLDNVRDDIVAKGMMRDPNPKAGQGLLTVESIVESATEPLSR